MHRALLGPRTTCGTSAHLRSRCPTSRVDDGCLGASPDEGDVVELGPDVAREEPPLAPHGVLAPLLPEGGALVGVLLGAVELDEDPRALDPEVRVPVPDIRGHLELRLEPVAEGPQPVADDALPRRLDARRRPPRGR